MTDKTERDPAALESIEALTAHLQGCQRCPLGPTRKGCVVVGDGDARSPVMFVGEGPGEDEDRQGLPFVGRAGQLFDKVLQAVGIQRQEIYITNVVKCRPPGNRVPTDEESAGCGRFLLRQVELIRPRIIVCMGNVARTFFLGKSDVGITRVRGTYFKWKDIQVVPVFHPSYLLRNPSRDVGSPKWLMWQDFQEIKKRLDLLRAGQPLPGEGPPAAAASAKTQPLPAPLATPAKSRVGDRAAAEPPQGDDQPVQPVAPGRQLRLF